MRSERKKEMAIAAVVVGASVFCGAVVPSSIGFLRSIDKTQKPEIKPQPTELIPEEFMNQIILGR